MQLRQRQFPLQFSVYFMRRRLYQLLLRLACSQSTPSCGSGRRASSVPLAVSEQAHREWLRLVQSTSRQVSGRGRRYAALLHCAQGTMDPLWSQLLEFKQPRTPGDRSWAVLLPES